MESPGAVKNGWPPVPCLALCLAGAVLGSAFPGSRLAAQAEVREAPPSPGVPPAPPPPAISAPRGPGGIVAIVNDDVVTQAELDTRVARFTANLARVFSAPAVERERARLIHLQLEDLIENKLILQLVKKEEEKVGGPFVTEAEIDAEINAEVDRLQKAGAPIKDPEDFYRQAREKDGVSREELRKMIKEGRSIEKYLIRNVYSPRVFVSPREARAYYKTHKSEFTTPVAVSFQQIVIRVTKDGITEHRVQAVENGRKAGAPFAELAKKFSQEAVDGRAEDAGTVITRTFEEIKKDYWEASYQTLRSLKKGQISERVVTPSNIFYYHVVDIVEGAPKSFPEVQEIIRGKLLQARHREELENFIAGVKKRARIQVFLPPLLEAPAKVASAGEKAARESAAPARSGREEAGGNGFPARPPAPSAEPAKASPAPGK